MEIDFTSKCALVTGAGRGIGRDIVRLLVRSRACVIAVSLIQTELDSLKQELSNSSVTTVCVDLSDWASTERALALYSTKIDLLVNNAAICECLPLEHVTADTLDRHWNLNVKAAVNVTKIVSPGMKQRKCGSIVNTSSISSLSGFAYCLAYGACKGALDNVTKVLALELGQYNIRVNSVNPTLTRTELSAGWIADAEKCRGVVGKIPLGRFAEPVEVAQTIVYLLSDKASMISGVVLPVDGGQTDYYDTTIVASCNTLYTKFYLVDFRHQKSNIKIIKGMLSKDKPLGIDEFVTNDCTLLHKYGFMQRGLTIACEINFVNEPHKGLFFRCKSVWDASEYVLKHEQQWRVPQYKFIHEHNICASSDSFAIDNLDDLKFCLKLWPKGKTNNTEDNDNNLDLFVQLFDCQTEKQVNSFMRFSIRDYESKLRYPKWIYGQLTDVKGLGCERFIGNDFIFENESQLLPDNNLLINCQIEVFKKYENEIVKEESPVEVENNSQSNSNHLVMDSIQT